MTLDHICFEYVIQTQEIGIFNVNFCKYTNNPYATKIEADNYTNYNGNVNNSKDPRVWETQYTLWPTLRL